MQSSTLSGLSRFVAFLMAAGVAVGGCDLSPDFPSGVFACTSDDDCPASQTCSGAGATARCVARGADVGPPCVPDGLVDLPDATFADSDCDGVDGTAEASVFVSSSGDDSADGTRAAPVRSISRGIEIATADDTRKDVLIAAGFYPEAVILVAGVNIHGGYGLEWARATMAVTMVRADLPLQAYDMDGPVRVTGIRFVANDAPLNRERAASSIAARVLNATGISLEQVVLEAGAGAPGRAPESARQPGPPVDGSRGANGAFSAAAVGGGGGANFACFLGSSACGSGGFGGWDLSLAGPQLGSPGRRTGSDGACIAGAAGGQPGMVGMPGEAGDRGDGGTGGQEGRLGPFNGDDEGYTPISGGDGENGQPGGGGGGGGGSLRLDCNINGMLTPTVGGAGGGGGAGGCGGFGGLGGAGGGASIGLQMTSSVITLIDVRIIAGAGGAGNTGQNGGFGGIGGEGGGGGLGGNLCPTTPGTFYPPGASGGAGGRGGGGGGAGGPSIALLLVNGAAQSGLSRNVTLVAGEGGRGGNGGIAEGGSGSGLETRGAPGSDGVSSTERTVTVP